VFAVNLAIPLSVLWIYAFWYEADVNGDQTGKVCMYFLQT